MDHLGFFENLAASDSDKRVAHRVTLAVANKRVSDRFGAFLAAAKTPSDHTARLDLIRADVQEVVASVCSEHGGDPERIELSILKHMTEAKTASPIGEPGNRLKFDHNNLQDPERSRYEELQNPNPYHPYTEEEAQCENCGTPFSMDLDDCPSCGANHLTNTPNDPLTQEQMFPQDHPSPGIEFGGEAGSYQAHTASVRTARKPKMCPYHKEVTDISLATGDPTSGFNAMSRHAWGDKHCQGGEYEGGCNFKPAMVTQSYWDDRSEKAREKRDRKLQEQQIQQQVEETQIPDSPEGLEEAPAAIEEGSLDSDLSEAPSAVGDFSEPSMDQGTLEPMAASTRESISGPVPSILPQQQQPSFLPPPQTPGVSAPIPPMVAPASGGPGGPGGPPVHAPQGNPQPAPRVPSAPEQSLGLSTPSLHPSNHDMAQMNHQNIQDMRSQGDRPGDYNKTHYQHEEIPERLLHPKSNAKQAEALETVDLTKDKAGPSPKLDKSKIPQDGQKIEDVEMDGSPHPTETIDPLVPVKVQDADFLKGTEAVSEQQSVDQSSSFDGGKADNGSWGGNNGASPVTSAVDPSVNPIREILESGFVPRTQVESAIKEWKDKSGE